MTSDSHPISTQWPPLLYVATPNRALEQATVWRAANPRGSDVMARLGAVPTARWFVGLEPDIETAVHEYVSAAAKVHALPVLALYNVPIRDLGSYSMGGAADLQAYSDWIDGVARSLGHHPAIVILEPDALMHIERLGPVEQSRRYSMLHGAVESLSQTCASVYLDAGHPASETPPIMAQRLERAGISSAAGFSLNVSNFYTTAECIIRGTELSKLTGGKHFVIDTSRNGNGSAGADQWCNPSGRALGQTPTLNAGPTLVDAYLWIKVPGESDGTAGQSVEGVPPPAAGEWWPEYALQLAQNAGW